MSPNGELSRDGLKNADDPSEQTPLLPPGPTTVDTSNEALPSGNGVAANGHAIKSGDGNEGVDDGGNGGDDGHITASQTITAIRGTLVIIALGCVIFLQATNISLLTTTQSEIAKDLDAFEKASWFTSAYLIAMSSTSPLAGKLSSLFSPRWCIFASTILLAIGVLISSAAGSFEAFIFGRVVTGFGAAGIFTVSIIIVLELTGSKRRGVFIGLLNSGYTVGVAAGATIAGALLAHTGWRALFWMQAPISLFGGTVLFFSIPHDFTAGKKDTSGHSFFKRLGRIDYLGATLLTASIVLVLLSLSNPRGIPILPIILSAVALTTFILNEVYIAYDPIIPVTLLRSRGLLLTCLGTVGYMMSRWTVLFYTPTYAIAVRQWAPGIAGSILIPTNGGFAAGGLLVGWFHIRRQGAFYLPSITVYAIFPCTLVLLALLSTQTASPWLYVLVVFFNGFVTGAALNYTLAHLLHLTPKSTHYVATSLIATFRGFAGSFGSSIGGGIFSRLLRSSLEDSFRDQDMPGESDLIRRLLGSPALVGQLEGVEQDIAIKGYQDALKGLFLAAAGIAALMVIVQAGTGWRGVTEDKVLEAETERLDPEVEQD